MSSACGAGTTGSWKKDPVVSAPNQASMSSVCEATTGVAVGGAGPAGGVEMENSLVTDVTLVVQRQRLGKN